MSLQPLHLGIGAKFAAVLAAIMTWMNVLEGALLIIFVILLFDPSEPAGETIVFLAMSLIIVLICTIAGQVVIRLGLGRFRTGGTSTRFARYQLAAFGVGVSLGIGFSPALFDSPPLVWILGVAAGVIVCGLSLLLFRGSTRRPLDRRPRPDIILAEGTVIESWDRSLHGLNPPHLTVVCYGDELGRTRFVRHLHQQRHTGLGAIGQVQFDRRRPEKALRFTV